MDQLKVLVGKLSKHLFWVLCVVVLLTGFAGWFMATGNLWASYENEKKKIVTVFDELRSIKNTVDHPNEKWETETKKLVESTKRDVLSAWEYVYGEQTQNVLQWPKELGTKFLDTIRRLGPNDEIPFDLRQIYWNHIQKEFPNLLAIVDAPADADMRKIQERQEHIDAIRRDPTKALTIKITDAPVRDYKVRWDVISQHEIQSMLNWNRTPSSKEVRYAQENLWVCRALLMIINNLNENATGSHNAKVKEIVRLAIGQQAGREFQLGMSGGRIITPEPLAGTAAPVVASAGPVAQEVISGDGPVGLVIDTDSLKQTGVDALDDGRYVNEKGQPLSSAPDAPLEAPAEFKRMPVYLKLVMDQREISKLLVECANSPLPVEVRQLRIFRDKNSSMNRGGQRRVRGPATPTPRPSGGHGAAGFDRAKAALLQETGGDRGLYDVCVELHGIIYIFNPPDKTKLAAQAAAQQGDDAAAAADQPPVVEPSAADPTAAQPDSAPAAPAAADPTATDPATGAPAASEPAVPPGNPVGGDAAAPPAAAAPEPVPAAAPAGGAP